MSLDLTTLISEKGQILGHAHIDVIPGYNQVLARSQSPILVVSEHMNFEKFNAEAQTDGTYNITHLRAVCPEFQYQHRHWKVRYLVMLDEKAQWLWDNPGFFRLKQEDLR